FRRHALAKVVCFICLIASFNFLFYLSFLRRDRDHMALNISEQLKTTLQGMLSSIKPDRLDDILIGIVLSVAGFFIARLLSNAFIGTIGSRFNAHQRL